VHLLDCTVWVVAIGIPLPASSIHLHLELGISPFSILAQHSSEYPTSPTSHSGTKQPQMAPSPRLSPPPAPPSAPDVPPNRPRRDSDSFDPPLPADAPPSYDSAMASGDLRVASGPTRMDFSGPPPMPDMHMRPTGTGGSVLPGVGVGYERRQGGAYPPPPMPPPHHPNGAGSHYPGAHAAAAYGNGHQQHTGSHALVRPINTHPNPTPQDRTPTEAPTPGRPLLRAGQLLVYPRGHYCSKCGNTGYKNADPSHPCSSDWRKYGKAFNSALAHSYASPSGGGGTTEAGNFQRPLPDRRPAGGTPHSPAGYGPHSPGYGPPGAYPHPHPHAQHRPPQIQYANHRAPVPAGALYVQPGDPRIGGR
jgi:hypothetical protein